MADTLNYYKSAFTGDEIDGSLGRIINGELDEQVDAAKEAAVLAAENAEKTAEDVLTTQAARDEGLEAAARAEASKAAAGISETKAEEARQAAEQAAEALEIWEDYEADKTYLPLNKVAYLGSSYVCTTETTGHVPTDTGYWLLIAAKGDPGDGFGDMLRSVYDPTGKEQDVFSYADAKAEGAANAVQETLLAHTTNQENPHGVTAAQVGLGKTLTFTGAASGTYNGMAAQTVDIPAGKRTCRFVVGTSTAGWTAKDCDYLCDGADDQVQINAAIQALPSTGGEVVILDGTYNIAARIAVNKDNTTLTGNGQATRLQRKWDSTASEGVIHVTSSYNTIQNLQIDGNEGGYKPPDNNGIYLGNSVSNTITGNVCSHNSNDGIYLNGSSDNNTITGNTCNNNGRYGISLYSSSDNNTITGNTCSHNNGIGISLVNSSNNTITGNTCNNNGRYGIYLYSSSDNNTITGNTCNNNGRYGISPYNSSNNTITGNTCSHNNGIGISLVNSSNNTITGNTCIRGTGLTTDYTSDQYTIRLEGTNNNYNLIAYNNIMGKNYSTGGGTGNTFTGNKYN